MAGLAGRKATAAMIAAGTLAIGIAWTGVADAASCLSTAGERTANRYVEDCLQVSAATHPPCNVANSCALILGEIERSCAQAGDGDAEARVCRRYR